MRASPAVGPGRPRLRRLTPHCSPVLRAILADEAVIRRGASGPSELFPQRASHLVLLDPNHIPAALPEHWTAPLGRLDAAARALRRDAAIRLVQMVSGRPRASAARFLGMAPGTLQPTTLLMRTWQKEPGNAAAYQAALQQVIDIALSESPRASGAIT